MAPVASANAVSHTVPLQSLARLLDASIQEVCLHFQLQDAPFVGQPLHRRSDMSHSYCTQKARDRKYQIIHKDDGLQNPDALMRRLGLVFISNN